ncbi:RagB/SusD family nutrient uptake outer membrane protein [Flavihumibacter fluvii]|uniref:RagB/SusD family nutrient uptake outer membrane protein n=1 Tax=Flavihumibacter fluvii TaxID=2838157 RepID=UPI001BDE4633|nr:RagB/SusD family nutrient uptake outer membrane protein [Flavihumibacter fluvii]ULQ51934.1 RagB/SusD family nutrient uptake outer membrane protein [Flavihumibacter fluvii]
MKRFIILSLAALTLACNKSKLDETVFSSLGESNFYKNQAEANSLVNAAYSSEQLRAFRNYFVVDEIPTGTVYDRAGGLEALAKPFENFTWDATHSFFSGFWKTHYTTIYRANLVLDKVPAIEFDATAKNVILAEARFLRASAYVILNDLFGPVPLITSSVSSISDRPLRATKEELNNFIISEFIAAAEVLPTVALKGKATKGAAYAQLAKFYLNLKDWQHASEYAQKVIDLSVYALFDGSADRSELFNPLFESNREFIYIRPHLSQAGLGDNYISHAAPPNYKWQGGVKDNYATQFKTYTSFYNSFADNDTRKNAFITQYYNNNNVLVQLGTDDIRNFKFKEDLIATGPNSGNDFPVIRYADILLAKAEALNELNGPNAESIDLLNQVRRKAGIEDLLLADLSAKDNLRNAIFRERTWEFVAEELHRQDQIRQGVFIRQARDRGIEAKDYQVLFPIPKSEIDINPKLEQNPGYN